LECESVGNSENGNFGRLEFCGAFSLVNHYLLPSVAQDIPSRPGILNATDVFLRRLKPGSRIYSAMTLPGGRIKPDRRCIRMQSPEHNEVSFFFNSQVAIRGKPPQAICPPFIRHIIYPNNNFFTLHSLLITLHSIVFQKKSPPVRLGRETA
jgi:hypothetical protein